MRGHLVFARLPTALIVVKFIPATRVELISVHIPKTAGVSFRNLLKTVYGEGAVVFDYADRVLDPAALCHVDRAAWERTVRDPLIARLEAEPALRVVHGHFAAGKYFARFPAARRIVWLREPVARLVSHYQYWRGLPHAGHGLHRRLLEENLSLEEFASLDPMRDCMSRLFLDGAALEDFDFVGLQEHFDEDLAAATTLFGWPPLEALVENRTGSSAETLTALDPAARRRLEDLNPADMDLYRLGLKLRGERILNPQTRARLARG
jgi:hypothetical protein